MALSWSEIERVEGLSGLERVVRSEILPALAEVEAETTGKGSGQKDVETVMGWGFGAFGLLFIVSFVLMPDNFLFTAIRFVLFPILFFGCFIGAMWLFKDRLVAYALRAFGRMEKRAEVLSRVADHAGLTYVAAPGERPAIIDWLAKQSWIPLELREAMKGAGGSGEMLEAVEAMRDSRLLIGNLIMIGSKENKTHYEDRLMASLHFEDGFHGERNGMAFDILEWKESQEDAEDIYHLFIVLRTPRHKQGVIQLKSRKARWWPSPGERPMEKVRVGPDKFREAYDVRADDQVEAHALFDPAVVARMIDITHGDEFRASAIGDWLVFDVAGENRFAVLDPATGEWSEDTVRQGLSDLAESLNLVDALGAAFRSQRARAS
ncbi:MAG: DUF3137 domain-containing protein [Pseudomonadota bacterium]